MFTRDDMSVGANPASEPSQAGVTTGPAAAQADAKRAPATSPAVIPEPGPELVAPDHPGLRALFSALMSGGSGVVAWRPVGDCAEIMLRVGLEPVRVRFHAADAVTALREVSQISPLALDVLAVLADRLRTEDVEVRLVRCAEILSAKGRRRWGEERHALQAQVARELMRLGQFSVGPDHEPMFAVTPVGEGRTGFVVALRDGVREAWQKAPLRRVSPTLLEFDHRSNRGADVLAKKLGLYFSLAGAGSRPLVRSVATVLKAIGLFQEVVGGARGGRLADRFEEAILRLQERGLFLVAYRGGREPPCDEVRIKGWVKRWLDAELVVRSLT